MSKSTMIIYEGKNHTDFVDKLRRCGAYLHENVAPISPFSVIPGEERRKILVNIDYEHDGGLCLWGEGQVWLIKQTEPFKAEIWVDDEIAATMVAMLS